MTTHEFTAIPYLNTDARYRAWVEACIEALTAAGLVQTADSGQAVAGELLVADLKFSADSTRPAGTSYAVFRFDDALQGSHPLYLRLDFAAIASNNYTPQMWLTVGRGSNGTGGITGALLPPTIIASPNAAGGTQGAQAGMSSGGDGYVAFLPTVGWATRPHPWFIIERSPSGEAVYITGILGAGTNVLAVGNTASGTYGIPGVWAIAYASGVTSVSVVPVVVPYSSNGVPLGSSMSLAAGSLGPVFPWTVFAPGQEPVQLTASISYPGGDAPSGVFSCEVGGVERSFRPIPITQTHCGMGIALEPATQNGGRLSTYMGLAIRWEN